MSDDKLFEKPKFIGSVEIEDFHRKLFNLFELDKKGKEILEKFHEIYIDKTNLPVSEELSKQFGGAPMFLAFKEGQSNVILYIESVIKNLKENK